MSGKVGARGYPVPFSHGSQKNYMAEAEAIVGQGKPLESFRREDHAQVLQMAIKACKADGRWPEKQARPGPDKLCAYGHQFPRGKECPDCKRAKDRKKAQEDYRRQYRDDPEFRERKKARSRADYERKREKERQKAA